MSELDVQTVEKDKVTATLEEILQRELTAHPFFLQRFQEADAELTACEEVIRAARHLLKTPR